MTAPLLSLRGILKHYGPVHALDGVDFDLFPGEIVGLVGDNGAGKSTLVKVMSGATEPDAGTILFEGKPVVLRSPQEARGIGIETVYQDLAVVPWLDVEANLFLGREITGASWWNRWFLNKNAMRREAARHIASLQVGLKSVRQPVGLLSGGQRQSVAVARAISWGRKVVIMDEPTAALGVRESRGVLDLIKRVKERGLAVVLVSHNLPHVFEITDRIFVLRQGRAAGTLVTHEAHVSEVVGLITGVRVSAAVA
ncbi:MAG: ATP-binding cassette domain-containing protein [Rhodospirillales bacterium]|nr:ATP-binding cassette domain-containing protein [Rhodospirillales bacterium]